MTVLQSVKEGPESPTQCKRPPEPNEVLPTRCTPGGGNKRKRFNHYVIVCTYHRNLYKRKSVESLTVYNYDNITLHKMLDWSCVEIRHYSLHNRRGFIRKGKGKYVTVYPTPTKLNKGDPHPPHKKRKGTTHCPQDFAKEKFFQKTPIEAKGQGGQIEGSTPRGNPPCPQGKGIYRNQSPTSWTRRNGSKFQENPPNSPGTHR